MTNIFEYNDYREFLKDSFEQRKTKRTQQSLRSISRYLGIKSSGYLSMVLKGQRNLNEKYMGLFASFLDLPKKESDYFNSLVRFNQAKTDKERNLYFENMVKIKPQPELEGLDLDMYELLSKTHLILIYQMLYLDDFCEDAEWINSRMRNKIRPQDIESALNILQRLGLASRTDDGRLVAREKAMTTAPEVHSLDAYNYHKTLLSEAMYSMLSVPSSERDLRAMTLTIPNDKLDEFKDRIQDFLEETLLWANEGQSKRDEVYQLNVQFYPRTQSGGTA